ncbi:hypothetical protein OEA41_001688 [Lepraria neglecta]|uniref:Uncharacterized protein n=1 Tax=Lepraria neglecta TaxID=209136 RepID=A0AAD9ZCU4_9LECA|nr:hypothetical protein OEA41_001688 [Lepraria neglecta]
MDKAKNLAKGGWHPPGKNGGKESWRGDNKGINQVAGWLGKGKDTHTTTAKEHTSRPLASLKDPDAFGPPPKNVNYHSGAAVPNAITPDRRGLAAPVTVEELPGQTQEQEAQKPKPPPVPYRANTTGLNTNNLPKPPVRRVGDESPQQTSSLSTKSKPSLPPRLPPRQNSNPGANTPDPPPTYTAATQQPPPQNPDINQGALGRLGKAGVSVPGLGIGSGSGSQNPTESSQHPNPWSDQLTTTSPTTTTQSQAPSLSNLGSRFSKLSTASPPPTSTSPAPPSQGTSLQQKRDALSTASMFRNDPSSVSLSDARGAASTANNFRERHGEQVAAGGKWAGAMNKKYDVAGKVGGFTGGAGGAGGAGGGQTQGQGQTSPVRDPAPSPWANEPSQGGAGGMMNSAANAAAAFSKRTPPPPPAARRPGVASPPPVPLGSKPRS